MSYESLPSPTQKRSSASSSRSTSYGSDPFAYVCCPTIDLIYNVEARESSTFRGIYKLDGDTLTICSANPGKARPTAFESREESNVNLSVLRRVKK
jgi:hypothetical protein